MFGTVTTYILIFVSIKAKSRHRPDPGFPNDDGSDPAAMKRAAKYMIIYPVVYVVCTLPLAGARMASMTGSVVVPYCTSSLQSYSLPFADCTRVVLSCWRGDHLLRLARRLALRRDETCPDIHSGSATSTGSWL